MHAHESDADWVAPLLLLFRWNVTTSFITVLTQNTRDIICFLLMSWLHSRLARPRRACALSSSVFFFVFVVRCVVSPLCHTLFLSHVCPAVTSSGKSPETKKKGNDGFSCFLNARSLTTLLPTVCLCLPHWTEAFQPLIKWILSSWTGSMCVQNKWTHCILKGHSHTSVVMNSEWSWLGTWTCRWVWRLLWSLCKKVSSIQDVCHAVNVKPFLVSLWTFYLEVKRLLLTFDCIF